MQVLVDLATLPRVRMDISLGGDAGHGNSLLSQEDGLCPDMEDIERRGHHQHVLCTYCVHVAHESRISQAIETASQSHYRSVPSISYTLQELD